MVDRAIVKIWGEIVGAVLWDENSQLASFEYDPRFFKKGYELSPFKMPLATNTIYNFPELRQTFNEEENTFNGLPGLLADILPDRYGNRLLNTWLAQQGRPENSMNPVEKLCFIGTRGMGAIEFEPSTNKRTEAFTLEMDSLVNLATTMLNDRKKFITNIKDDEIKAMQNILAIGTSAGGARAKAIIAYNEKTGIVKSGQTKSPKGFKYYLMKLDGVDDAQFGTTKGYGRIEMAYYYMATACGIDMMPSRLLEENGRAHFLTQRYDREDNIKHHIQTFCAIKHFDYNNVGQYSYEQLFQTMRELGLPYPQAEQMFKRMVFNVIARNCDDHTKNFAFRLKKDAHWEITPAYDICHAYRPPGSNWVSKHALSINGKRENITLEDFLSVAKSMRIKKPKTIIAEINNHVQQWEKYAEMAGVEATYVKSIKETLLDYGSNLTI